MVEYLFISIIFAVVGLALVVGFLAVALPRAQARRVQARKKRDLTSQEDLERFISQVEKAETFRDLDHLAGENQKEDDD